VTAACIILTAALLVGGLVYITTDERPATRTTTILETTTQKVPVQSSPTISVSTATIISSSSNFTDHSIGGNLSITSTVTSFVTTTLISTSVGPTGTTTTTVVSTTTTSSTITQTTTTTVESRSSSTASNQFNAEVVSCTANDTIDAGSASCEIVLTDSGLPTTLANGCTLTLGGIGVPGTLAASDGGSRTSILVPENGGPVESWCLGSRAGGKAGSPAYGTIALSNSESLQFMGFWQ